MKNKAMNKTPWLVTQSVKVFFRVSLPSNHCYSTIS